MITIKQAHTYQKLVDNGIAELIPCLEEHRMLPFEKDGEVVFFCPLCDEYTTPGAELEQKILDVVSRVTPK